MEGVKKFIDFNELFYSFNDFLKNSSLEGVKKFIDYNELFYSFKFFFGSSITYLYSICFIKSSLRIRNISLKL